jgi:hypothetical protein
MMTDRAHFAKAGSGQKQEQDENCEGNTQKERGRKKIQHLASPHRPASVRKRIFCAI